MKQIRFLGWDNTCELVINRVTFLRLCTPASFSLQSPRLYQENWVKGNGICQAAQSEDWEVLVGSPFSADTHLLHQVPWKKTLHELPQVLMNHCIVEEGDFPIDDS